MILSKGANDEVFVLSVYGLQILISDLIDFINANFELFEVRECKTNILMSLNGSDYIDKNILNYISEDRIDEPVLVTRINECEFLIDGNHRLHKRNHLSMYTTKYIPIDGNVLDIFIRDFSMRLN